MYIEVFCSLFSCACERGRERENKTLTRLYTLQVRVHYFMYLGCVPYYMLTSYLPTPRGIRGKAEGQEGLPSTKKSCRTPWRWTLGRVLEESERGDMGLLKWITWVREGDLVGVCGEMNSDLQVTWRCWWRGSGRRAWPYSCPGQVGMLRGSQHGQVVDEPPRPVVRNLPRSHGWMYNLKKCDDEYFLYIFYMVKCHVRPFIPSSFPKDLLTVQVLEPNPRPQTRLSSFPFFLLLTC